MPFMPTTLISKKFYNGSTTMYYYDIQANYSGTLAFDITANAQAVNPTWNSVTLNNGNYVAGSFTTPGSVCQYRVIGNTGDMVFSPLNIITTSVEVLTAYNDIKDINLTEVNSDDNSASNFKASVPNQNGQHLLDFNLGDEIKIFVDKDINPPTTLKFTGTIENTDVQDENQVKNTLTLTGRDYTSVLQNTTVAPSVYTNLDSGSIVRAIIAEFCPEITTINVQDSGFIVDRVSFNHPPVYDAIKQLADYTNFSFKVDTTKDLNWGPKGTSLYTTILGSANVTTAKFTNTNRKLFNQIWVYGDRVLSTAPIINPVSDGIGSVVALAFKPYNVEVIKSGTGPVEKGAVFNQNTTPPSGTVYLIDYDGPNIIWVSGTGLGNNIPISGTTSSIKYDRSLPIVKYADDTNSVELYGPSARIINDKNIKDPRTAVDIAQSQLTQLAYPKEQGTLTLQGINPISAGQSTNIYLPYHGISGAYNVFQIDYRLNPVNNFKDEVMYIKVGEKVPDITDTVKQTILDIRKIQAGDIDPTDIITRIQAVTGSVGTKVKSWFVRTASIGSDWYLGSPASINGWVGSPGSYYVGSHAITYTIQYSGGD